MPKHDISLSLDFSAGDPVTHLRYGEGVIDYCEVKIGAKNKVTIAYIVDFSDGSEFRVLRNCISDELQLRAEGAEEAKKK